MDAPALIEQIRTHLPQGLTPAQVDALLGRLAGRPALCEALSADLSRKDAPPLETFADLAGRLDALAASKRSRGPLVRAAAAAALLLLGAVIVLVARPWDPPAPATDETPATQPASTSAPATQTATAPTSRPDAKDPAHVAASRPAGPPMPQTPARMTSEEFALPGSDAETDWAAQVATLFRQREGKGATLDRNRKYVTVEGTCGLTTVPGPGRLLRLGLYDAQQCGLEFWNGLHGVRVELDRRSWLIRAHLLVRKAPGAAATITRSADDGGTWRWYAAGAIDLRYQGGELMVCRGEIPLIRIPLPVAPTEGLITCTRGRFWLAEGRDCRPLILPAAADDEVAATRTTADKLTWTKEGSDTLILAAGPDGVMALSTRAPRDQGQAWCEMEVAPLTGVEAIIHVREATLATRLMIRAGGTAVSLGVTEYKGSRVVGWGDRRMMADDVRYGRTVEQDFRVRVRRGFDTLGIWVSADGKTWWPRGSHSIGTRGKPLEIGLYVTADKQPRRVAVGEIRLRRFTAIQRMAGVEADLLTRVGAAMTKDILSLSSKDTVLAEAARARPDDVDPDRWRHACALHLAGSAYHTAVRHEAMREVFLTSCRRGAATDVPGVLRALDELNNQAHRAASGILSVALNELARSCLDHDRTDTLGAVMDAAYVRPGGEASPYSIATSALPALLRIVLLDLMERGRWKDAYHQAMRAMFMTYGRERRTVSPLAQWAAAEARSRLAQDAEATDPAPSGAWSGPLVVDDNPATMNVMGEFLFLAKARQYSAAAKALTRTSLPDALITLEGHSDLLQSSHFIVRRILRATPQLREILRKEHLDVGAIRLERARKQNDLATLTSLAVQFDGTAPGLGALGVLADRDLSSGNFAAAAARYNVLQAAADYPKRDEAAAKFRLAGAMMGRLTGAPITTPVVLPGGTFTPEQFEQMVKQLAADRKGAGAAAAAESVGPAPGGTTAKLTHLADLAPVTSIYRPAGGAPTSFAADGTQIAISHGVRVFVADSASGKGLWSTPTPSKTSSRRWPKGGYARAPARILRVGGSLIVRTPQMGELACFDSTSGRPIWRRQYDHRILSDPIWVGSSVVIITARYGQDGSLQVRHLSPETGESSFSHRLMRLRDEWPPLARPAVIGETMTLRSAGCLINCDLQGTIRWARRLPFLPADAAGEFHTHAALDDMIVWKGRRVIFTAPGSPRVACVDIATGEAVWSRMIPAPVRLAGLSGGHVILVESDRVSALDPATGKTRWNCAFETASEIAVLPAANDTLMLVRLKKPSSRTRPPTGRYLRWLSAKDGRPVREITIDGDTAVYGVAKIFSDSRRVFGLSNFTPSSSSKGKLFVIEIAP